MAKNTGKPLNMRELSELTGKGFRTIRAALGDLEPLEDRGRGGIFYDSREALPLIYSGGGAADDGDGDLVLARERALLAKAQREKIEMQTAAESGRLVSKAKADLLLKELGLAARRPWEQWPARVDAEMAAALGVPRESLRVELEEQVHRHLTEISRAPVDGKAGVVLAGGLPDDEDDEPEGEGDDDDEA